MANYLANLKNSPKTIYYKNIESYLASKDALLKSTKLN